MRITITENQYGRLFEQSEDTVVTPTSYSEDLITFLKEVEGIDGKAILYTYDDGYLPTSQERSAFDSSRYKKNEKTGNRDPKGTLTIGYGHTGKEAYEGNVITEEKAIELLKEDLAESTGCVNRIINAWKEVGVEGAKMNQCQYDAIASLVFNAGCKGVRISPWIQDVKKGDWEKAATTIPTWNVTNADRRKGESEIFSNCAY